MNTKKNFRYDINALRALAVIAVVIYHFKPNLLPGGFAGVDVFFVISGFLMTKIIFSGILENNFNLSTFFLSRIKRIVPPLLILCVFLVLFGWFFLSPIVYQELTNDIISSLLFVSNIAYWFQVDYFDPEALEKWLLHTWSLSVEWQFYIIYPLVIVAMRKFMSVNTMKKLVLAAAALSFIFCIIATYQWPNLAYYILPTRMWEMMLGGVAFLYPFSFKENIKKKIELFGLSLIISTFFFVSKDNSWPGYLALFPVLGAFLLIQAKSNGSLITNNIVSQKIGIWSYSIYLWHWPVVVAFYYFGLGTGMLISLVGIAISIGLGFLSFYYVEKNNFFKFKTLSIKNIIFTPFFLLTILFIGLSLNISLTKGYMSRLSKSHQDIVSEMIMPHRGVGFCFYDFNSIKGIEALPVKENICSLSSGEGLKILNFGDSYSGHYEPFWSSIGLEEDFLIHSLTTNWCYPSFKNGFTGPKSHKSYSQCLLNRQFLYENFLDYDVVILSAKWTSILHSDEVKELEILVNYISQYRKIIIMPSPTIWNVDIGRRFQSSLMSNLIRFDLYKYKNNIDDEVLKANDLLGKLTINKNVFFIEPDELFNENSLFNYKGKMVPYSLDGGHLSLIGSKAAFSKFNQSNSYYNLLKFIDK
jgi:peptidoglycan/LPS O-acetylase OafA/YrhL